MRQLRELKLNRTRPSPAEKLYTEEMNRKMNSYLRSHSFPRSLSSFIDVVGGSAAFPSNAKKLINLISKNNFELGHFWGAKIRSDVLMDEPTTAVTIYYASEKFQIVEWYLGVKNYSHNFCSYKLEKLFCCISNLETLGRNQVYLLCAHATNGTNYFGGQHFLHFLFSPKIVTKKFKISPRSISNLSTVLHAFFSSHGVFQKQLKKF